MFKVLHITVRIPVVLYYSKNTRYSSSTVYLKNSSLKAVNVCLDVSYNIQKPRYYESKILIVLEVDELECEIKSILFWLHFLSTGKHFPNFAENQTLKMAK